MQYRRAKSPGSSYFFDEDFRNHLDYIHYNPVRHGLVSVPKDWRYSSFHQYVKRSVYDVNWGGSEIPAINSAVGME